MTYYSERWEKELKSEMAPTDDEGYYLAFFKAFHRWFENLLNNHNVNVIADWEELQTGEANWPAMIDELEGIMTLLEPLIEWLAGNYPNRPDMDRVIESYHHVIMVIKKHKLDHDQFFGGWSEDDRWKTHGVTEIEVPEEDEGFGEDWQNLNLSEDNSHGDWWETLKTGGPITSGKAGITNMAYGKGAQKPKKKKKFKPKKGKKFNPKKEKDFEPEMPPMPPKPVKPEKAHPIIPDEPDFWRD